jgi:hypothetical protein
MLKIMGLFEQSTEREMSEDRNLANCDHLLSPGGNSELPSPYGELWGLGCKNA